MRAESIRHSSFVDLPPQWVSVALGDCDVAQLPSSSGRLSMQMAQGRRFTLVSALIADAVDLAEEDLRREVSTAYSRILAEVDARGQHAVRFWNFIPSLHAEMGPGLDRYMVFNSGRFLAYSQLAPEEAALARTLPTASGVGSATSSLTIHCFAGPRAGRPIEHIRQIPAYRYSFKYGPHPPCFARATLVDVLSDEGPHLLVGGTASVRGEDSIYLDRLDAQIDETLANLASIVGAGTAAADHRDAEDWTSAAARADDAASGAAHALARFTDLRVYLPRLEHQARVSAALEPNFPGVAHLEFVQADLCRRELLVEIEGVATMAAAASGPGRR